MSPAGLQAAVEKAVHTSLKKIGAKSKQNKGKKPGKSGKSSSFLKDFPCSHCDENGHERAMCPHKSIQWYKVPPKNKCYTCRHSTKSGPQPVTHCTTCKSWCYYDDGGHLAKDHDEFLKGPFAPTKGKGKKNQSKTQPTATPAMAEEDIEEVVEEEVSEDENSEEDNDASAFSAMWTDANWI